MTSIEPTRSNWREVLYAAVNKEGFHSIIDFLDGFPCDSYESLAEKLGFDSTDNARRIRMLHCDEAIRQKRQKHAIMDVLVRYINRDQVSWDRKTKSVDKRVGKTYYGWYSFVDNLLKNVSPAVKGTKAKQVWDTLEMLTAGQPEWCPKSVDDPIIVKAFEGIEWQMPKKERKDN